MSWTISRAARETGLSKSTISRAIKSGKLSAARREDNSYQIDPAELFRVYPKRVAQPPGDARHGATRNPPEQPSATPSNEVEILKAKLEMTREMLSRERETVDDLRKRLDAATDRVLQLTRGAQPLDDVQQDAPRNPAQPPVRRSIWSRLTGR